MVIDWVAARATAHAKANSAVQIISGGYRWRTGAVGFAAGAEASLALREAIGSAYQSDLSVSAYNRNRMAQARRLVALLCLALVLAATLTPGAPGLFSAVLVPLWFFVAAVVVFSMRRDIADSAPGLIRFLPVLASRAPPIA
jgi:hypothetical protein